MSPGWRGYGCTDGREAFSDTSQLVEVLLLTLSNLFFFPAIIVALYRRHYVEAVVYFYNMFTSTVSDFIFASVIKKKKSVCVSAIVLLCGYGLLQQYGLFHGV